MKKILAFFTCFYMTACTVSSPVVLHKPEQSPSCTRCDYKYNPNPINGNRKDGFDVIK